MENNKNSDFLTWDELEKWAVFYAESEKGEQKSAAFGEWLVFKLDKNLYTVSMNELYEVARMTGGAALPHPPPGNQWHSLKI